MTREEIMNMSAGREMDALIAEKIFGWSWSGDFLLPPSDHPASVNHWCAEWDDEGRPHWLPNYSTDIADAWVVVGHMVNNGYCPGLLFDDNGHWALAFDGAQSLSIGDEPDDVSTSFFVGKNLWCDTAALAICRAALLAVMEAE